MHATSTRRKQMKSHNRVNETLVNANACRLRHTIKWRKWKRNDSAYKQLYNYKSLVHEKQQNALVCQRVDLPVVGWLPAPRVSGLEHSPVHWSWLLCCWPWRGETDWEAAGAQGHGCDCMRSLEFYTAISARESSRKARMCACQLHHENHWLLPTEVIRIDEDLRRKHTMPNFIQVEEPKCASY